MSEDPFSEFKSLSQVSHGKMKCAIPAQKEQLSKEDRELLDDAIAQSEADGISNAGIARWMQKRTGIKTHWQGVRSHRMKVCSCYDE